ncbi:MAG: hypothetical protein ACOY4Q_01540 [Bacillota bacterium]
MEIQEKTSQHQSQPDLVNLWEQMGASTGSLIGRFIGLNAKLGLDALKSLHTAMPDAEPGIRSKVWTEMGRSYGESLGYTLGLAMDGFIKSVDNSLVRPLVEADGQNRPDNQ